MAEEKYIFLSCLADYVNERNTSSIPSDSDIPTLVRLSKAQQLASVLYYQTEIEQCQSAFSCASYYAINREKLLKTIDAEYTKASIDYLIIKGSEVAKFYRYPHIRTSGDMDLMVRAEDKEKAGELLESLGFCVSEHKSADHEWVYTKGNYEIELHHRLLYEIDNMNNNRLTAFTDTAWEHVETSDSSRHHLETEFHFVFLLLHLRKHFLWAGVGIRQFMDLAVMIRNAELSRSRVEEYIKACGIERFSSVCFALIERWFGISSPFPSASLSDDFYRQATDTVLSGSVFGDMSHENLAENYFINDTNKRGRLLSFLAVVFPPYEQLSLKYPGLRSRRFLLPFYWLRRMVDAVLQHTAGDRFSYAAKHITGNRDRYAELKQWGLM